MVDGWEQAALAGTQRARRAVPQPKIDGMEKLRCPACQWEGIELPDGGLLCAEHGRYDMARDNERLADLDRQAAEFAQLLARGGLEAR